MEAPACNVMRTRIRAIFAALLALAIASCLGACAAEQKPSAHDADTAIEANGAEGSNGAAADADSESEAIDDAAIEINVDYENAVVSYLGPEGTYTQEACQVYFKDQGTYLPKANVSAAVEALLAGESSYAVIPQENTIGGPVIDYLDELLAHDNLAIVGEVELPINQNLLVQPGTKLEDIKIVYSHIQGLIQGDAWLAANIPNAETIEVGSTAEGARLVSESTEPGYAAIGSKGAAGVYGLEMLAEGIQMSESNKTRFYVLTDEAPATASSDRMVFVASGAAADLPGLLSSVAEQGMTLVAAHARPEKTELGRYVYLLECADATYKGYCAVSENEAFDFRFLGCFPVM